jgi:serine/threonine protein kinase/CRP-like cAMP-binding protein
MYIIKTGEISVSIDGIVRRSIGPGEIIGELSLLHRAPRSALCVVTSVDGATLYSLSRSKYEEFIENSFNERDSILSQRLMAITGMTGFLKRAKLVKAMRRRGNSRGTKLYTEGEPACLVQIIDSGYAAVFTKEDLSNLDQEERYRRLGIIRDRATCSPEDVLNAEETTLLEMLKVTYFTNLNEDASDPSTRYLACILGPASILGLEIINGSVYLNPFPPQYFIRVYAGRSHRPGGWVWEEGSADNCYVCGGRAPYTVEVLSTTLHCDSITISSYERHFGKHYSNDKQQQRELSAKISPLVGVRVFERDDFEGSFKEDQSWELMGGGSSYSFGFTLYGMETAPGDAKEKCAVETSGDTPPGSPLRFRAIHKALTIPFARSLGEDGNKIARSSSKSSKRPLKPKVTFPITDSIPEYDDHDNATSTVPRSIDVLMSSRSSSPPPASSPLSFVNTLQELSSSSSPTSREFSNMSTDVPVAPTSERSSSPLGLIKQIYNRNFCKGDDKSHSRLNLIELKSSELTGKTQSRDPASMMFNSAFSSSQDEALEYSPNPASPSKRPILKTESEELNGIGRGRFSLPLSFDESRIENRLEEIRHGYVIKFFNKNDLREDGGLSFELLVERMRLLHSLEDCPFVMQLHGVLLLRSILGFVVEPLLHGNLGKVIKLFSDLSPQASPVIPLPLVKFYTTCLASALDFLRERNVVYRDLKPKSILFDSRGYPRLVDFTRSTLLYSRKGMKTYTVLGCVDKRDICYRAPEFAEGRPHDTTADLWSLGVIVFEMLTGNAPYDLLSEEKKSRIRILCPLSKQRSSNEQISSALSSSRSFGETTQDFDEITLSSPMRDQVSSIEQIFTSLLSSQEYAQALQNISCVDNGRAVRFITKLIALVPEARASPLEKILDHELFSDVDRETINDGSFHPQFRPERHRINLKVPMTTEVKDETLFRKYTGQMERFFHLTE